MDWIMIPLNCLIVFGAIYKVVELFVRKRERLMLISKLTEDTGCLRPCLRPLGDLRWSLIVLHLGMPHCLYHYRLVVAPTAHEISQYRRPPSPQSFGQLPSGKGATTFRRCR